MPPFVTPGDHKKKKNKRHQRRYTKIVLNSMGLCIVWINEFWFTCQRWKFSVSCVPPLPFSSISSYFGVGIYTFHHLMALYFINLIKHFMGIRFDLMDLALIHKYPLTGKFDCNANFCLYVVLILTIPIVSILGDNFYFVVVAEDWIQFGTINFLTISLMKFHTDSLSRWVFTVSVDKYRYECAIH